LKGYTFRIFKADTGFNFYNNTGEKQDRFGSKWSHYAILHRLLNFMRSRGWSIKNDESVGECIRKGYWIGRKGDLEFCSHRYPIGFKIDFFQNIIYKNPNGGRYDFDRFDKMPYLIKLLFQNEVRHMKLFLESLGCVDTSKQIYKKAEDEIKQRFVECCHHPQKTMDEFELSDLDGQTCKYSYNNTDRDKKTIYNGQIKYFRDRRTGRLMRGIVYHNINNMWWVILNHSQYTNIADFELFDPSEVDFKNRRLRPDRKPKEYLEKVAKIKEASNKELLNELKRRGMKVSA